MLLWIKLFWDISRFQKGPQDVPFSPAMLWLLLLAGIILDCIMLSIREPQSDFGTILLAVLTLTLVSLAVVFVLLYLMGFAYRINQTITSLLGTGLLLGMIALPFFVMVDTQDTQAGFPVLMLFFLNIWSFMITVHILKHALMVNYFVAGILAFGFFILGFELVELFFPPLVEPVVTEGIRAN